MGSQQTVTCTYQYPADTTITISASTGTNTDFDPPFSCPGRVQSGDCTQHGPCNCQITLTGNFSTGFNYCTE